VIIATTASAPVFGDISLTKDVEIQGNAMVLKADGRITSTASFKLTNAKITQGTLTADFFLLVKSTATLKSVTVTGFSFGSIRVESGTLALDTTTFSSNTGTCISISEFGASFTDLGSTFTTNTKALEYKPSSSKNSQSVLSLTSSKFSASPIVVEVSTAYSTTSQHQLTMNSVEMTGSTGTLLSITAHSTLINVTSCTFTGAANGITLVLSGVAGSINTSTFSSLKNTGLLVTSLKVNLVVSGCKFLNNNYGASFQSIDTGVKATVTGCIFQGNRNSGAVGAGLYTNGGDVVVNSCQFINNAGAKGGALYITLGNIVQFIDTEISDSTSDDFPALYCFRMKLAEHTNLKIKNVVSKGTLLTYSINEDLKFTRVKIEDSSVQSSVVFIDGTAMAMFYFNEYINVSSKFSFVSVSGRAGLELQDTKFINVSAPYIYYKILLFSNCIRCLFHFKSATPEAIIIEHTGSQGTLDGCEFIGNFKAVTYGESQSAGVLVKNSIFHDGIVHSLFGLNYYPLEINNITATNMQFTNPLDYPLNQGTVTAKDITITNSTGGFFFLQNSPMSLTNLRIDNFGVIDTSKFLKGAGSKVSLSNVRVSNFRGTREGSLFMLTDQSELTVSNMTATNMSMSIDPGLVLLQDSNMTVSKMRAHEFDNTLFSITGGFITVSDSVFTNGGLRVAGKSAVQGGFMYAKQCNSVWLTNNFFSNLTSDEGAVLYMVYTNPLKPSLASKNSFNRFFVSQNSEYKNSVSRGNGGAISLNEASSMIMNSTFLNNTATGKGGGLYFGCSVTQNYMCYYNLANSSFLNNSAEQGGGLSFYRIKPTFENITYTDNKATYGVNIASYPIRMGIVDSQYKEISELPYFTVSGSSIPQPLTLGLFDDISQVVSTESRYSATLKAQDEDKTYLIGQASALASKGIYKYSELTIVTSPGTAASLQVTSLAIDYSQPDPNNNKIPEAFKFDFPVRDCILGEILSENTCKLCEPGTYSLEYNSTFCNDCKTGMNCFGGSNITLDKNYWRPSNMSDELFDCPIDDICLAEEECEEGYKGRLCAECDADYFRLGRFYCMPCGDTGVGVVKGVFTMLGLFAVMAFMIWSSLRGATKGKSISSVLIRIMINFSQVMMLLNNFDLSWPLELTNYFDGMEFLGNTSQVAFSTECVNSSSIKHIFVKEMFMAFLPIGIILISLSFWGIVALVKKNTDYLKQHFVCTLILLLLTLHPNILNTSFNIMSCKLMENDTWWLIADFSVECWKGDHLKYTLSFAVPSLIVWGVVTPISFLVALLRSHATVNELPTRMRFSYLFNGYSAQRYYWEFIITIRKSVIVALSMFLSAINSNVQSFTAILFIWVMLSIQYYFKPYSNKDLNNIEELSLATNIVTLYCGMYFDTDVGRDVSFYVILILITFVINAIYFLYWIAFLVYSFKDKLEKIACLRPLIIRLTKKFMRQQASNLSQSQIVPDITKSYIYSPKSAYEADALNVSRVEDREEEKDDSKEVLGGEAQKEV